MHADHKIETQSSIRKQHKFPIKYKTISHKYQDEDDLTGSRMTVIDRQTFGRRHRRTVARNKSRPKCDEVA